ncbi:nitroreductase family protein [Paenibacillus sp. CAA11]|uniref:nitroreductase family protein n=1 Tax=Paenibacillus sp. CAA11 TaxID=1532905 RepID=UPI000D36C906|nr:nitroreductase family protein [Paenibacillus sp. CAA11]AWB46354.1 nitroreductase family protein [Paenibacillus sp. CAA11]
MSNELTLTSDFVKVLKERRSVRHYDPHVKISRDELKEMLELALTAPSSSNLQPWRFLIIDDQELQEKLLPIANNQQQVRDASAVIAVLGDLKSYEQAEKIYNRTAEAGFMSEEIKNAMIQNSVRMYGGLAPERLHRINQFDAGLVSMQLMLVARAKGYDTVPMGGYNVEKFKEAFSVPETLEPALLIAIGKAAQPGHPSSRLTVDEVTYWNEFH